MFSFPSSRRLLVPALLLLTLLVTIRLYHGISEVTSLRSFQFISVGSVGANRNITFATALSPSIDLQDRYLEQLHSSATVNSPNFHITRLLSSCKHGPNPHTNHVRLSKYTILNISMVPPLADTSADEFRNNKYFNPAIIPLPSFIATSSSTRYEYLVVSRLVTTGTHQESHICLANICVPRDMSSSSRTCTDEDIELLGEHGGMRCTTNPEQVNIPSTPARKCTGVWKIFPDIPGFHDPRIFWSGRGEPLIEMNSGSTYGCVGLWLQDLRRVFLPLETVLKQKRRNELTTESDGHSEAAPSTLSDVGSLGTPISYPRLTELTRNPKHTRAFVEKNWILFFPTEDETYLQYNAMARSDTLHRKSVHNRDSNNRLNNNLNPGRTMSQLLSHGLATPNLTSPFEPSCFLTNHPLHITDPMNNTGHWHQGTNSLRIVLCTHVDFLTRKCTSNSLSQLSSQDVKFETMSAIQYAEHLRKDGAIVHFSIVHRKFTNDLDLPMRYERYVIVWEARAPFRTVAVSKWPIVFGDERVRPWSYEQDIGHSHPGRRRNEHSGINETASNSDKFEENDVYFTYTPSIAWAYRGKEVGREEMEDRGKGHEDLGTGHLDDDVLVGIGMDDVAQGFVKVPVGELLGCLRNCPTVLG